MNVDRSIPGYAVREQWPRKPELPFKVDYFGRYRDGGVQGGTCALDLKDKTKYRYTFFFENNLGRLCWGASYEKGNDAAFIKKGSQFELEVFAAIEQAAKNHEDCEEILECLSTAKIYTAVE
ncbi:hypothetical protein [Gilvimarinus polysaccharolyticus]|uniref:hypothetical protein n=1 Tax=Gilvimarinus polysaccharolyticus TaxID=863921 RepID=UPI000673174E|nr:hypothetical protein [Gilvimarinus polysaccharolyticus]